MLLQSKKRLYEVPAVPHYTRARDARGLYLDYKNKNRNKSGGFV